MRRVKLCANKNARLRLIGEYVCKSTMRFGILQSTNRKRNSMWRLSIHKDSRTNTKMRRNSIRNKKIEMPNTSEFNIFIRYHPEGNWRRIVETFSVTMKIPSWLRKREKLTLEHIIRSYRESALFLPEWIFQCSSLMQAISSLLAIVDHRDSSPSRYEKKRKKSSRFSRQFSFRIPLISLDLLVRKRLGGFPPTFCFVLMLWGRSEEASMRRGGRRPNERRLRDRRVSRRLSSLE